MTDRLGVVAPHGLVTDRIGTLGHASHSMLSAFRSCPARWAVSRLLPDQYGVFDARILGVICHAALERTLGADGRLPADGWLAECRRVVERDPGVLRGAPMEDGDGRQLSPVDYADAAAAKLSGFDPDISLTPAVAEQRLDGVVWGVPFTGVVDYRDANGFVLDWKTGRVPNPAYGDAHGDQLRTYVQLLRSSGVDVSWAADVYVEHDGGRLVAADLTQGRMDETRRVVEDTWSDALMQCGRGVFDYRPSALCGWCPLANKCPFAEFTSRRATEAAASQLAAADPVFPVESGSVAVGFTPVANDALGGESAGQRPDPERVESSDDKDMEACVAGMMAGEGKPYEPTLRDGRLNVAGYALTALYDTRLKAMELAARHEDWVEPVETALLKAQCDIARRVYPTLIPAWDGKDPVVLARVLDSVVARDARRILFGLIPPSEALIEFGGGLDTELEDVRRARNQTFQIMAGVRGRLMGE